jgi:hypothetical protein
MTHKPKLRLRAETPPPRLKMVWDRRTDGVMEGN